MKITEIGKNLWMIDYTHFKKRYRVKIHGTRRMAEDTKKKIEAKIVEEKQKERMGYDLFPPKPKKRIKFKDYSKMYKENYSKEKRSYENEVYIINRLDAYFGDMFLDRITPGDVDNFKLKRKKDGVRNGTINNELRVLKTIFNKAIDSEDYGIERNPVKKAGLLRSDSKRERILEQEEMERLLAASYTPWGGYLPLFLLIALNTGMRKTEILTLKWGNVDFKTDHIEVTKERAKSGKARKIPMNSTVKQELEQTERKSEFIFYNASTGTHIKHIKCTFKRACKQANIHDLTIHDLRHTAASRLVNDCGISIAEAAKILGHANIEMTMKYVHPTEENMRKGVEKLGRMFDQARLEVDSSPKSKRISVTVSHLNYCN